jgi:hypothetical protein
VSARALIRFAVAVRSSAQICSGLTGVTALMTKLNP